MNENNQAIFSLSNEEKEKLKTATFNLVLSLLENPKLAFPSDLSALIDFIRVFG